MARALGLPAVLAVPGLLERVRAGDEVVVDGTTGTVIIDPTPETLAEYRAPARGAGRASGASSRGCAGCRR